MTVIWQGDIQYQNTINIKGPVASVEREERPDRNFGDSFVPYSRSNPVAVPPRDGLDPILVAAGGAAFEGLG